MTRKIAITLHWIGFIITCFMLILSFLNPSKDEIIIHFIASIIPNSVCWIIAFLFAGKRHYLPFINNY